MNKVFFGKNLFFAALIFISIMLFSCSKHYHQPRIIKNKINITDDSNVKSSDLSPFIKQRANRKILFFFPFHLRVYQLAESLKDRTEKKKQRIEKRKEKKHDRGKKIDYQKYQRKSERTFRSWLMETIGEQPSLLDSNILSISAYQIQLYLRTKGYFDVVVDTEIERKRNKKAIINYNIKAGTPFRIKNFSYNISDNNLKRILHQHIETSSLQSNIQYDEDLFDKERDKITRYLRNTGYYHFSKSHISFQVDSNIGNKQMDVTMNISPFRDRKDNDTIIKKNHPISKINNIYFYPEFVAGSSQAHNDTTVFIYKRKKRHLVTDTIYFIHKYPLLVKEQTLIRKCFLRKGDLYITQNALQTQNGLSGLNIFRYINIRFTEEGVDNDGFVTLDAHIELSRLPKHSFSTEAEGTNSAGNLGLSGNLIYRNRNIFGGAEQFTTRIRGALEAQQTLVSSEDEGVILEGYPLNTIETGFETKLVFPKFLLPVDQTIFSLRNEPRTSISAGIFFQQRPDFTRYLSNLSLNYEWNETQTKHHSVSPIFLNLVRIDADSAFIKRIEAFSRSLQTSYKDHLIAGMRWTYTFTNQTLRRTSNYSFFRLNVETAGNMMRISSVIFQDAKPEQTYTIFGIRFAQYFKTDFDFRQYFRLRYNTIFVARTFFGFGVPYGNIDVLPFDKRYSAGGSNDIRAWRFRSLGPGSYSDAAERLKYDKTGDLALIMNLEYRFPIYGMLHSALFIDAGNTWFIDKYEEFPGGEFNINNFHNEIAIGAGIGARLNFGFFVFRLDAGVPVRDPAKSEDDRWVGFYNFPKRTNFNFGIGYPF